MRLIGSRFLSFCYYITYHPAFTICIYIINVTDFKTCVTI